MIFYRIWPTHGLEEVLKVMRHENFTIVAGGMSEIAIGYLSVVPHELVMILMRDRE